MSGKIAALVCLLSLGLAGCGEISPQPAVESGETAGEELRAEPEELLVAVGNSGDFEDAAESFQREYPQYRITLLKPGESEDSAQFRTRIMEEVENGQGPDILGEVYVDPIMYAETGYIQPWGEIFTVSEQEKMLPGILDAGRLEGHLYGIPYRCYLHTLVTAQSRVGNEQNLDLNRLIQLVEESGAKRLASRLSPTSILEMCALSDRGDNSFIDWENLTCNFMGEDFFRVLRFAREYGDREYIVDTEQRVRRIRRGEDFAEEGLSYLEDICLYEAVLEGEDVYIGFPGKDGKKTVISTSFLFLNGASSKKEAAVVFLKYLLSEEQQNRTVESAMADVHTDVRCGFIRVDTLEYCLSAERQQNRNPTRDFYVIAEIPYYKNGITEEQEQQFRSLMDAVCYKDLYQEGLMKAIYADDPLTDYYDGNITETEAAEKLQAIAEDYFVRIRALKLQ